MHLNEGGRRWRPSLQAGSCKHLSRLGGAAAAGEQVAGSILGLGDCRVVAAVFPHTVALHFSFLPRFPSWPPLRFGGERTSARADNGSGLGSRPMGGGLSVKIMV